MAITGRVLSHRHALPLLLAVVLAACSGTATPAPTPLAPSSGPPPTASPSPTPRPCAAALQLDGTLNVLVVGDSIAGGSTAPKGSKWWDTMTTAIQRRYPDLKVAVNVIAMGGTGLDYAQQAVAGTDLTKYQAVVLVVGINDADDVFSLRTISVDDYRVRYRALIDTLAGSGRLVLVGNFPPSFAADGSFFGDYKTQMEDLVAGVAERRLVDLAGIFLHMGPAVARPYYSDAFHPNADGQQLMGALIAEVLKARGALPCA